MYEIYRNQMFLYIKVVDGSSGLLLFHNILQNVIILLLNKNRLTYLTVNQKDKFNIFIPKTPAAN